mgnify:CR=1 FL=1
MMDLIEKSKFYQRSKTTSKVSGGQENQPCVMWRRFIEQKGCSVNF